MTYGIYDDSSLNVLKKQTKESHSDQLFPFIKEQ